MGQALKSSIGDESWLKFFLLMSSAIALREDSATVPGTPSSHSQLARELNHYASTLGVAERMQTYAKALQLLPTSTEDANWYLLRLSPKAASLEVVGFRQLELAQREYDEQELATRSDPDVDVVLVAVESNSSLQRAYPSYFADTKVFLELLHQAISGQRRRIRSSRLKEPSQMTLPGIGD